MIFSKKDLILETILCSIEAVIQIIIKKENKYFHKKYILEYRSFLQER